MTIGERIKERRLQLNMTVDQVAEILGKNKATVYRYENDEIENMPIHILEPLAKALHTTPAYLAGWDDQDDEIHTFAAHKNNPDEEWTREELEEIERFKEFVKLKRKSMK